MSTDAGDDVVGQGGGRFRLPDWRVSRGGAVLAVAGVVAGLLAGAAAGYAVGERHSGRNVSATVPKPTRTSASPASSSPASTSPFPRSVLPGSAALVQLPGQCSIQVGQELQLGVQVVNESATPVTLNRVVAVMPIGGLRPITQQWGPCGSIQGSLDPGAESIAPGATDWFTVTLKVLRGCPSPYPVQFAAHYQWDGRPAVARLPGFADLSGVRYKGCPVSS